MADHLAQKCGSLWFRRVSAVNRRRRACFPRWQTGSLYRGDWWGVEGCDDSVEKATVDRV